MLFLYTYKYLHHEKQLWHDKDKLRGEGEVGKKIENEDMLMMITRVLLLYQRVLHGRE